MKKINQNVFEVFFSTSVNINLMSAYYYSDFLTPGGVIFWSDHPLESDFFPLSVCLKSCICMYLKNLTLFLNNRLHIFDILLTPEVRQIGANPPFYFKHSLRPHLKVITAPPCSTSHSSALFVFWRGAKWRSIPAVIPINNYQATFILTQLCTRNKTQSVVNRNEYFNFTHDCTMTISYHVVVLPEMSLINVLVRI